LQPVFKGKWDPVECWLFDQFCFFSVL